MIKWSFFHEDKFPRQDKDKDKDKIQHNTLVYKETQMMLLPSNFAQILKGTELWWTKKNDL